MEEGKSTPRYFPLCCSSPQRHCVCVSECSMLIAKRRNFSVSRKRSLILVPLIRSLYFTLHCDSRLSLLAIHTRTLTHTCRYYFISFSPSSFLVIEKHKENENLIYAFSAHVHVIQHKHPILIKIVLLMHFYNS